MKTATTIFLTSIIFLQTFSRFVVEADYLLNKSYIAKVLCVNKEKPSMHCEGKCCLAKKLKEQEKQDQQTSTSKKPKLEVQQFFLPATIQFSCLAANPKLVYPHSLAIPASAFTPSVFHPPSA